MDTIGGQLLTGLGFAINLTGTLLNGLGIWCVCRHTPSNMRNYSILLLQTTIADFMASASTVYTSPRLVTENGKGLGFLIVPEGPCKYLQSPRLCEIGYCLMLGSTLHSLLSLPMSFFYRWWVITHPVPRKSKILLALLASAPLTIMEQTTCNVAFEGSIDDGKAMYYRRFNTSIDQPAAEALFVTLTILRYPIMHTIVYLGIMSPIVYYFVFFFRAKINRVLNLLAISEATRKQHQKLVKMLVLQAMVPVAAAGTLPIFFLSIKGVLDNPLWQFPMFHPLNMVSVLQPLIMFWAVEPYRKAILGIFWWDYLETSTSH